MVFSLRFFFRFYRDYTLHHRERVIPLQLNWFVNGEETPVDHPAIRLRELWIDKEKGLFTHLLDNGKPTSVAEPSASRLAEQFFEDVLKSCFGIAWRDLSPSTAKALLGGGKWETIGPERMQGPVVFRLGNDKPR